MGRRNRQQRAEQQSSEQASSPKGLKVRNQQLVKLKLGDICVHEKSWQAGSEAQESTLDEVVGTVGFYGYMDVFKDDQGRYVLINGRLRLQYLKSKFDDDHEIAVNLTDLTPEEAETALLAHDSIARMAGTDKDVFKQLVSETELLQQGENVQALVENILGEQTSDSATAGAAEGANVEVPDADVAMRQLFFNRTEFNRFDECIAQLRKHYGTTKTSETVLEALRRCHRDAFPSQE